ncbi:MAG: hypothetical protein ABIC18_03715 [Candidatus Omnitrophota bacterium]
MFLILLAIHKKEIRKFTRKINGNLQELDNDLKGILIFIKNLPKGLKTQAPLMQELFKNPDYINRYLPDNTETLTINAATNEWLKKGEDRQ